MTVSAGGDVVLTQACNLVGLDATGFRPLHSHATAVYLLPAARVVVRISSGGDAFPRIRRAVDMTSWLAGIGFPVVPPAAVDQPVAVDEHVVSFWTYYRQDRDHRPTPADLGHLLRRLHQLPDPPVELPTYEPLSRFVPTVAGCHTLSGGEQRWLLDEARRLLDAYARLDSPLGRGHIHGDAYPGNLLQADARVVLTDWDETARGPREIDLANTYQGTRFGRTAAELDAFAHAYGHDLRRWPGLGTLCAIRDLHTLGSYMRRAGSGDELAASELRRRVRTLQSGDRSTRWAAG